MKTQIEQAIDKILASGTRCASFTYNGKRRNVLIGAKVIQEGTPLWGVQVNRAIREHNGKRYLVAKVQNDESATIKCFELSKIENPCAILQG